MQTADVWDCGDRATRRRLGSPMDGSIFIQREMSAPFVIVDEVAPQVAAQRALVPHDDVIEALAPERSDHTFDERILPRKNEASSARLRYPCAASTPRIRSVHRVTIPDDEAGRPRPRLAELLRGPRRGRTRRDVHVDDAASIVR